MFNSLKKIEGKLKNKYFACIFIGISLTNLIICGTIYFFSSADLIFSSFFVKERLNDLFKNSSVKIFLEDDLYYESNFFLNDHIAKGEDLTLPIKILNIINDMRDESNKKELKNNFFKKMFIDFLLNEKNISDKKNKLLFYLLESQIETHFYDEAFYFLFFNNIYYSPTVMGLQGASKAFFNKQYSNLNPLELSYLLLLLLFDEEYVVSNSYKILEKLASEGAISKESYNALSKYQITPEEEKLVNFNPQINSYIASELSKNYSYIFNKEGDLLVKTYGSYKKTEYLKLLIDNIIKEDPNLGVTFLLVNHKKSNIELILSSGYFNKYEGSFNKEYEIGDMFLPFVYFAAFEKNIPPNRLIEDKRYNFIFNGQEYSPTSFTEKYHGKKLLREALLKKLVNPSVKLSLEVGLEHIQSMTYKLGYNGHLLLHPSLSLGKFNVSPIKLAEMYTALMSLGKTQKITYIKEVRLDDLPISPELDNLSEPFLDPLSLYQLIYILQSEEDLSSKFISGTASFFSTTTDKKTQWGILILPDYLMILVLDKAIGSFDDSSEILNSITLPILSKLQKILFPTNQRFEFAVPEGIIFERINKKSGLETQLRQNFYIEAIKNNKNE